MTSAVMVRPVTTGEWGVMVQQAGVMIKSGFLPTGIKTEAQAIAIMMKGRELGIPPMYALSNIAMINGKPTASAELMLALIYREHGGEALKFLRTSPEVCTIEYKRKDWIEVQTYEFSLADAKRAGLAGRSGPWTLFPQAMLRARCISAVARLAFPDVIGGLYTPEELGAPVGVEDQTGEVVVMDVTGGPVGPFVETERVSSSEDDVSSYDIEAEKKSIVSEIYSLRNKLHLDKDGLKAFSAEACGRMPDLKSAGDLTTIRNALRDKLDESAEFIEHTEALDEVAV